ncbi:High affinity cAMP-specific 3',5'-cyclic phosphodiesterase 7A [Borealophlyctis nickersoniae]|nr:High affinity cAMP-specific 3',5'-cyclic phosphodiesterase 7A [Borealophlyctis nickersoniae]
MSNSLMTSGAAGLGGLATIGEKSSSRGSGCLPYRRGPSRDCWKSMRLSFLEEDVEAEYQRFFLTKNMSAWRRTVWVIFWAATGMYLYVMIRSPNDGKEWEKYYSPAAKGNITEAVIDEHCPHGWYCMACNPDFLCNAYSLIKDIFCWVGGVLLPTVVVLAASYKLKPAVIARYIHWMSVLYVVDVGVCGLMTRFRVVEPETSLSLSASLCIMLVYVSFIFMRVRFIYTVPGVTALLVAFAGMNAPTVYSNSRGTSSPKAFFISFLGLLVAAGVVSFSTYETELFNRTQFLNAQKLKKTNAKLTQQLKTLQKGYVNKAADFDTPLEKSFFILRSLMADPALGAPHLMALAQVMQLLNSSNLLTPDLENQLELLDNEQEAWLFSEIAPRRKGRGRMGNTLSNNRRRQSLTAEIGARIDPAIEETTSPSSASIDRGGGSLVRNSIMYGGSRPSVRQDASPSSSPLASPDLRLYDDLESGSNGDLAVLLGRSNEFNWPIFDFADMTKGAPLSTLAYHLFRKADLFNAFQIPLDKFHHFLNTIEKGYRADNPYHNSTHASDVLHCSNYFLHVDSVAKCASDADILAVYIAAIIHDYEHPGVNNNFLVATQDTKAILYNDRSVLENHHLAASFRVLSDSKNNFLSHLPKADFKAIREAIIEMVLATDLSQHFQLLSMFKTKMANPESYDPYDVREDRILLWRILVKCADVSNPTKSWSLYERWARLVLEEFWRQGDQEKRLGLPCSPFMDRDNTSMPSSQLGFIDYVVFPLYDAFAKFVPLPGQLAEMQKNREHWWSLTELYAFLTSSSKLKAQGLLTLSSPTNATNSSSSSRIPIIGSLSMQQTTGLGVLATTPSFEGP